MFGAREWGEGRVANLELVREKLPQLLEAFTDTPRLNKALISVALATRMQAAWGEGLGRAHPAGCISSLLGCRVTEVTRQRGGVGTKCLQSVRCVPRTVPY